MSGLVTNLVWFVTSLQAAFYVACKSDSDEVAPTNKRDRRGAQGEELCLTSLKAGVSLRAEVATSPRSLVNSVLTLISYFDIAKSINTRETEIDQSIRETVA